MFRRCGARRYLRLAFALGLVACRDSLPTGPSDLQSGLIVYEHADYLGDSAHIAESVSNLDDSKGPCIEYDSSGGVTTTRETWDDCISSVRLALGWRATLYRDDGFDGDRLDVTGDIANLQLAPGDCDDASAGDASQFDGHVSVARHVQQTRIRRVRVSEGHRARRDGQADHERGGGPVDAGRADRRPDEWNIVGVVGGHHARASSVDLRGEGPQRDSTGAKIHHHDKPLTHLRAEDTGIR